MRGGDVLDFQRWIKRKFEFWRVEYPLKTDGIWAQASRTALATIMYGMGVALDELRDGVTPELRIKLRNANLTPEELQRARDRAEWRDRLREKHRGGGVCMPLARITDRSNGYSSWHDGIDLICPRDAPGFAVCKSVVVRADNGHWWSKAAPRSWAIRSKGDGILVLRSLVDVGPIKKDMNFAYGHAEGMRVRKGQVVEAGHHVCRAGMANAPHFHFMVNMRRDARGLGDIDPWPILRWIQSNS